MADRKAELEKKRKKLEELKKARELRKVEAKDKEGVLPDESVSSLVEDREDVNKLVNSLLGGDTPSSAPVAGHTSPTKAAAEPPQQAMPRTVGPRRTVKLVMDQLTPVNIRPKEIEMYAKQTQTDVTLNEEGSDSENEERERDREPVRQDSLKHEKDKEEQSKPVVPNVEMSSEQVDRIISSEGFISFIDRSSRLVERALCDSSDILFDYIVGDELENGESPSSMRVVKKKTFSDERWTQNRAVNAMDWSGQHPELLLVSYYTNPNIPHDPDGVALMWDLKFQKDTPDYVFNCQSPLMSVAFSKFHPSYVIGGTYSGQIVLWDTRSGKRTPIQRSPLSSSAHTHPVYCLDVVGSQNAHNLISVSTNGKLCSWNLDMLSQPQESLELTNRATRLVAATCMSFPTNDVNKFLLGSEECCVYQGQRHGSKPGISLQFDGHSGPITSVSSHRASGGAFDFSHLFLTSSFDWTIKLWTSKFQTEQQMANKVGYPLCSFENNAEYVYDVQWSPVHPAIFASADGEGKLDFWDINVDTEVPIVNESLGSSLCKICWSPNGHHLACGDITGAVHLYETGEGFCSPHADEWTKLQQTILDLQENQELSASLS